MWLRMRAVSPPISSAWGILISPDIAYRVEDHARYFEAFVEKLNLGDVRARFTRLGLCSRPRLGAAA